MSGQPEKEKVSRLQQMFGRRKENLLKEDVPQMNVKGHKAYGQKLGQGTTHIHPDVSQGALEKQLFGTDKGPRMLPRAQRFKVWFALTAIGGWFVGCFSLVAYRLRSDDLELMEREVYEELKTKKEVQRF
jgi:hypothetical protein